MYAFTFVHLSIPKDFDNFIYIKDTRFGKPEPKHRCTKRKIQTTINEKACKRYARGIQKINIKKRSNVGDGQNQNIKKLGNSDSGKFKLKGGER